MIFTVAVSCFDIMIYISIGYYLGPWSTSLLHHSVSLTHCPNLTPFPSPWFPPWTKYILLLMDSLRRRKTLRGSNGSMRKRIRVLSRRPCRVVLRRPHRNLCRWLRRDPLRGLLRNCWWHLRFIRRRQNLYRWRSWDPLRGLLRSCRWCLGLHRSLKNPHRSQCRL